MTEVTQRVEGGSFCGAVRFAIRLPLLFCGHCHCSMCRRAHGAGYVTWMGVAADRFTLLSGTADLVAYRSSDHGTRSFCRLCGSSLLCTSTRHPEVIDVVLANLDDPAGIAPQVHIYFDDRAPWVHVEDGLPRLGGPTGTEPLAEKR